MIDLRNGVNRKEVPHNENPNKIIDIVEKILHFNKQQKHKGHPSDLARYLKILPPKQMLQRLPVALALLKTGNTSENLLN